MDLDAPCHLGQYFVLIGCKEYREHCVDTVAEIQYLYSSQDSDSGISDMEIRPVFLVRT